MNQTEAFLSTYGMMAIVLLILFIVVQVIVAGLKQKPEVQAAQKREDSGIGTPVAFGILVLIVLGFLAMMNGGG